VSVLHPCARVTNIRASRIIGGMLDAAS